MGYDDEVTQRERERERQCVCLSVCLSHLLRESGGINFTTSPLSDTDDDEDEDGGQECSDHM